ncbi:MAG: hypothetical protein FJY65_10230 [Calditrichaeota bacterium]|nr:hypothetical protein [Calditrichota bacterium]
MDIDPIRLNYIQPPQPTAPPSAQPALKPGKARTSFAEQLRKACDEVGARVEFSGHAQDRAQDRNVALTPAQLQRVDTALDAVAAKGGKKALVMLDDLALIVGVDRRTVVTLVDGAHLRENVFTAIDAAVIA